MPHEALTRYLKYEEITILINELMKKFPDLMTIESIGKSYEGREIWVITVTNIKTGPACDKPAMLVDGNIHATEVTASTVALAHLLYLLEGYGHDKEVTRCLDTRAFYIIPRVNPDGAEAILSDSPRFLRSSTRLFPYADPIEQGLVVEDVDGNGKLLTMRVRDKNGKWKKHPDDSRVMIKRAPTEEDGEFYRIFAEGRLYNYDGVTVQPTRPPEGLDLNRNWPSNWAPDHLQPGAGDFPLSEPEIHAMAHFVSAHRNIVTWVAGHTFSGVLLRPGFMEPDEKLPGSDLDHYTLVGAEGTRLTGYPAINVFNDFRVNQDEEVYGSIEWGYSHRGIFLWAPEYWAPHRAAGFEVEDYARWFFDHDNDCEMKLVNWSDRELGEEGFVDWFEFDHPELGSVELGGFDIIRGMVNPPESKLFAEVEAFPKWFLWQHLMSPLLNINRIEVMQLAEQNWKIRAVVENRGYLPSYGTEKAMEIQVVREGIAEIQMPANATILHGDTRQSFGQLMGRSGRSTPSTPVWAPENMADRALIEWIVQADKGTSVTVEARHERAGVARASVDLV